MKNLQSTKINWTKSMQIYQYNINNFLKKQLQFPNAARKRIHYGNTSHNFFPPALALAKELAAANPGPATAFDAEAALALGPIAIPVPLARALELPFFLFTFAAAKVSAMATPPIFFWVEAISTTCYKLQKSQQKHNQNTAVHSFLLN
eukprot:TRINITY_DN74_c0_g1_i16.p2 TRINITY_DN74_c0_g1~~TRINITY_DN74_c0_g1_i16.p2  ORF type:complete len:148 (-),score=15.43 TRINITY_DN74_c0_g1_i16:301-744(-)